MKLSNIKSAYSIMQTLYGCSPTAPEFEEIALQALQRIGNKHTQLYRYITNTQDKKIEMPCNCYMIESIHLPIHDAQMTSNKTVFNHIETMYIESYIDVWKRLDDPLYTRNKLAKYREEDNTIYFSRDYDSVMCVYHGILCDDEDGLPLITDKEASAIAAFVAYAYNYRIGLQNRDPNTIQIAKMIEPDWLRLCNSARTPEYISQNDMDKILDAKTSWNRKAYGRSLKPIV